MGYFPAQCTAAIAKRADNFSDILTTFITQGDVAKAQADLQQACVDNGICK